MVTATWVPPMQFAGTAPRGATVLIDATQTTEVRAQAPPMENSPLPGRLHGNGHRLHPTQEADHA